MVKKLEKFIDEFIRNVIRIHRYSTQNSSLISYNLPVTLNLKLLSTQTVQIFLFSNFHHFIILSAIFLK